MEHVITAYLKDLNIPISRKYVEKRIASHPDYPSLLSISDTLDQLGIPHGAVRVEKENLAELPVPYLLHLKRGRGEFFTIKRSEDLEKNPDILDAWDGVVLLAEAGEMPEDEENRISLAREKAVRSAIVLSLLSASCVFTLLLLQNFSMINLLLLATAAAGILLGYLLIAKDLGITYEAVESFCRTGQKSSCDEVLRSEEAKVFGEISLSDVVLSYFTFQFIVAGFFIPVWENVAFLWVLAAGGVLALPTVGYSLYVQGIKLKSWCRLCLLVDAVLLVQATLFGWLIVTGLLTWSDINLWAAGLSLFLLLATGSLIFLVKNRIKEGVRAESAERAASRIKNDPVVFTHLLVQEKQADDIPLEGEITIGDPHAPVRILMAASLGCGPCKEGFEKSAKLVTRYPEKVNLSIRFLMPAGDEDGETGPGRYILSYWNKQIHRKDHTSEQGTMKTVELIRDWYALKNLDLFKEKYPQRSNGHDDTVEQWASRHAEWFDKAGLKGTPTFFVNGYKLPEQYRIENLGYLVAGFSEQILATGKTGRQRK